MNTFGDIDWLLMLAVQIYNRSVARVQVIRDYHWYQRASMSVSEKLSSTGTVRENSFHESQTTDSVFAEIKFEELKSSIECDGLVVIDVRSAAEIEDTGKLPRSFNIPREFMRTHEVWVGIHSVSFIRDTPMKFLRKLRDTN